MQPIIQEATSPQRELDPGLNVYMYLEGSWQIPDGTRTVELHEITGSNTSENAGNVFQLTEIEPGEFKTPENVPPGQYEVVYTAKGKVSVVPRVEILQTDASTGQLEGKLLEVDVWNETDRSGHPRTVVDCPWHLRWLGPNGGKASCFLNRKEIMYSRAPSEGEGRHCYNFHGEHHCMRE